MTPGVKALGHLEAVTGRNVWSMIHASHAVLDRTAGWHNLGRFSLPLVADEIDWVLPIFRIALFHSDGRAARISRGGVTSDSLPTRGATAFWGTLHTETGPRSWTRWPWPDAALPLGAWPLSWNRMVGSWFHYVGVAVKRPFPWGIRQWYHWLSFV
jgi:hypothetical protein